MNIEQMRQALACEAKVVEVDINGVAFKMKGVPDSVRVKEWDFWLRPDGMKLHKARQPKMRAKIVALAIVDDDGHRPFNTDEGVDFLHGIDAATLSKLSDIASSVLGLADEDIEDKLKKTSDD